MAKPLSLLLLGISGLLIGCSKPAPPAASEATKPAESSPNADASPGQPLLDACAVISKEEIASIFGQPVQEEPKKLESGEGGFHVSQCRVTLQEQAGIIDLRIVQKGAGAEGPNPREAWNETFSREKLDQTRLDAEGTKWMPEEVAGLGEAAYWRGETKESSLYALKGSAYIRITLASRESKEEKLRKCTALAESVLKQL